MYMCAGEIDRIELTQDNQNKSSNLTSINPLSSVCWPPLSSTLSTNWLVYLSNLLNVFCITIYIKLQLSESGYSK